MIISVLIIINMCWHYEQGVYENHELKFACPVCNKLANFFPLWFQKLIEIFGDYAFLWLQDVNLTFEEFLRGKLSPNPLRSPNRTFAGMVRQQATERSRTESRSVLLQLTKLLLILILLIHCMMESKSINLVRIKTLWSDFWRWLYQMTSSPVYVIKSLLVVCLQSFIHQQFEFSRITGNCRENIPHTQKPTRGSVIQHSKFGRVWFRNWNLQGMFEISTCILLMIRHVCLKFVNTLF